MTYHRLTTRCCRRASIAAIAALCTWVAWSAAPAMTLAQGRERPAGWDDATHERRVAPDYERLFATDRVHEPQIAIDAADFRAMQEDLRTIGPPGMPPGFGGRLGGAGPQGPPPGIGGPPGLPGGFGPPAGGPAADGFAQMAALMEAGAAACQDKPAEAACSANGMDGRCTAMFGGPLRACRRRSATSCGAAARRA